MKTKICSRCNLEKPIAEFTGRQKHYKGPNKGQFYTFERHQCKSCKAKAEHSRLVQRFGEEGAIKYKKFEKLRRRCRTVYHIDYNDALNLLASQNHKCKICQKPIDFIQTNYDQEACIDHHHSSGKVRGILCHWCNTGIGYFQDNPELLEKGAGYLRG